MLNMKKNGPSSFFFKIIQLLYSWRVIILRRKLNPGHYFTGVIFSLHRYRTPYFLCRSLTCPSYAVLVFTIRPSSWLHLLGDMKTIVFFVNGSKVRNSVQLLDTKFDEMIQNILHVKAIKKNVRFYFMQLFYVCECLWYDLWCYFVRDNFSGLASCWKLIFAHRGVFQNTWHSTLVSVL